jgi:hypothetical protein
VLRAHRKRDFRLQRKKDWIASQFKFVFFQKAVAYQFIEKAYTIYEQDITDSVAQFNAMNLLIPTLATLRLSEVCGLCFLVFFCC